MVERYSAGARFYDVLSGELFVYRSGRIAGIAALGLSRGDIVLDLGCGTGLNFPLLLDAVGHTGLVIGIDRSPSMLRVAAARVARRGWANVRFIEADLMTVDVASIASIAAAERGRPMVDAAFASYSLSVVDDRVPVWLRIRQSLRPGGRVGIVDMALPTGAAAVFAPLARLACAAGGADLSAAPWRELERTGTELAHTVHRGGHIHAVTGTLA
ncbi:class I SAM-dependent methyltransferase [Marisediminicola senii]|uniref:class I SAM-dependent methyltransferase n=1 Tax=Marisediminicola senii TaxID=2711233 RepID=UPI0013EA1201|nr:methyltransferase domain-containing protein [Marisediminicola senii]